MPKDSAVSQNATQHQDARVYLELAAVLADYQAKRIALLKQLNHAMAIELVHVSHDRRNYYMAKGMHSRAVAPESLSQPTEALSDPGSRAQHHAGTTLKESIFEGLVAERLEIQSYHRSVPSVSENDLTSNEVRGRIAAAEEKYAQDLSRLLRGLERMYPVPHVSSRESSQ